MRKTVCCQEGWLCVMVDVQEVGAGAEARIVEKILRMTLRVTQLIVDTSHDVIPWTNESR